ncbi:MAG: ATP-binding cassette domain-containing protein, partial [Bacteroidales bacterium]|nr:ATP-binding cassette domain-containing protein [Bacteroidales bacterium]
VNIDGQNPDEFSFKQKSLFYTRKIAMVHQALFLFDALSLDENIQLKNKLTSFKSDKEIRTILQKLDIEKQVKQKVKTLSYGQKQRLAIARALCQPFEFILLDEPFSHLDKENAKIAWELICEEANKQNAGIILTSLDKDSHTNFDKILNL